MLRRHMFAKVPTSNEDNFFRRAPASGRVDTILPWEYFNPRIAEDSLAEYVGYCDERQLCASANRSLTPTQAKYLCFGFGAACSIVVAFTYLQGNIIAPLFLLINALILSFAARAVWKASDSGDFVGRLPDGSLELWQKRRGQIAKRRFTSAARALIEDDRVWIVSGPERVQVGEFLNPDQRSRFFVRLERLLRLANAPLVSKL
jgi:uncharacterized membrane protein